VAGVDHFLKISGIQGESQDRAHKDQIEVQSWSWGLVRSTATAGGVTGKPAFEDLSITKKVDRSTPKLVGACATGKHFLEVVLAARRAEGDFDFLAIKLSDVTIPRFETSGEDVGSFPIDAFSFQFGRIEYSYTPQKADGTPGTPITWNWDIGLGR
jgi:type VI secretion system secreted protein Hcp